MNDIYEMTENEKTDSSFKMLNLGFSDDVNKYFLGVKVPASESIKPVQDFLYTL